MSASDAEKSGPGPAVSGDSAENPIGVFDSGVGGLTVVRAIAALMPQEHIVYLGDTARVPYGTKSARTVERYALENARMLTRYGVKLIVVACNTVSALAFDSLHATLPVPAVDVVRPGAKAAATATETGRIGLIGTRGTVRSAAYEHRIETIDPRLQVFSASCPLFVPLAEEGWTEGAVPEAIVREYLMPVLDHEIDVLILGCTHYPLLKHTIEDVCGPAVTLIDSAEAAAVEVRDLIERHNMPRHTGGGAARHRFFVTDLPDQFETIAGRFLGRDHIDLTLVDLPSAQGVGVEIGTGGC